MSFILAIDMAPPYMTFTESLAKCLTRKAWESVRQLALQKYQFRCALCGADEKGLNCHEVWAFSTESEVRKLIEVLPICKMCHAVRHMDRPLFQELIGFERMKEHFMRVNKCSVEEFNEYYQQHQEKAEGLVSLGTDHIIAWKTDYSEYASIVMQAGNLKRGYEWRNGYIVRRII